jgi:4-amino-4-deoxy-L-arabinose transferase-like glycosyltransferase
MQKPGGLLRYGQFAGVFLGLFLLGTAILAASGAWHSALTGYPDEAAHYVTGLMVHQYVTGGDWRHPVSFAENYYLHYPKVAIGHWPPFFYAVMAAWMLLAGTSSQSVLLLQPVLMALTGTLLFSALRSRTGPLWAALAAVCLLLLPACQQSSTQIMSEPLLALLTLLSALAVLRYLETGSASSLAWYSLSCFLAIMTKGSGLALVGLPVAAAVFSLRFEKLRDWRLYAASAAAAFLSAPWTLLTLDMVRNGMDVRGMTLQVIAEQAIAGLRLFFPGLGPVLAPLALAGMAFHAIGARTAPRARDAAAGTAIAVVVLACAIHILSPNGIELRRLVMAVPCLIGLAAAGGFLLQRRLNSSWPRLPRWLAPGLVAALFLITFPGILEKPGRALRQFYLSEVSPRLKPGIAVLVAGEVAENVIIAETAQRSPRPGLFLVRASKLVSDSDWSGLDYRLRLATKEDVARALDEVPVNLVVIESGGVRVRSYKPDHDVRLVAEALRQPGSPWVLAATGRVDAGTAGPSALQVYVREPPLSNPVRLRVSLHRSLGRELVRE